MRHRSEHRWRRRVEADVCVEALKEAIAQFGPPGIMNIDQRPRFTGPAWINTLT